jgi:hypothetical protein
MWGIVRRKASSFESACAQGHRSMERKQGAQGKRRFVDTHWDRVQLFNMAAQLLTDPLVREGD